MNYIDRLVEMRACPEAVAALCAAGHRTLQQAWDVWTDGSHMLWLLCAAWKMDPPCADCERNARLLACDCAERALMREREAGREPDLRSWAAVEVSRRYAHGESTMEELAASWAAAWDAGDAAGDAAMAAGDAELRWQADRVRHYFPHAPRIDP